jgi:hypothetical protein
MKIFYKVFAHTDKDSTADRFEAACREADYVPYEDELEKAKYIGMEVEILVEFDTETREFTWKS